MKTELLRVLACSVIAFSLGYFLAGSSSEMRNRHAESDRIGNLKPGPTNSTAMSVSSWRTAPKWSNAVTSTRENGANDLMPPEEDQRTLDAWVAETARERDAEYTEVFSQLGLGPEAIAAFKQRLVNLHQKANAAGWPLSALARARNDYDEALRSMVGEENYARYREYEAAKPAQREYDLIQAHVRETSQIELGPEQSQRLLQLLKTSQAYTTERWDGPYDPLPRPSSGRAQGIEGLNRSVTDLTQRSSALIEAARQAEMPANIIEALDSYYSKKVAEMQGRLAALERPVSFEELQREVKVQARERFKQIEAKARARQ